MKRLPGAPSLGRRFFIVTLTLSGVLLAAMYLGLAAGSTGGGIRAVWRTLFSPDAENELLFTIIWRIRMPRVLLAALVGGTLSLGGMVFQALLRNPLAEPYILGVSGGAAVGAIIGIILGLGGFPWMWIAAFAGSLATLAVLFLMVSGRLGVKSHTLLLAGVMVNAFCGAVITFLISTIQDSRLHSAIFWLMGNLGNSTMKQTGLLALMLLPCYIYIYAQSNTMNILSMGKDTAFSLGVDPKKTLMALLVITSLMVSATVSLCGLVGFVGLVIPHLLRLILGPDHRILSVACVLGGAGFMIICDTLARTLPSQGEIPAGVMTAMIGAPVFVYLLRRTLK